MRRLAVLAASVVLGLPAAAQAAPNATFSLSVPSSCAAGYCSVILTYDPASLAAPPARLAIAWDHRGAPDAPLVPDLVTSCGEPLPPPGELPERQYPCTFESTTYETAGPHTIVLEVTDRDGATARSAQTIKAVAAAGDQPVRKPTGTTDSSTQGEYELCLNVPANVVCKPGDGMQTAGGGEKVSHKGWPKITGVFWKVNDSRGHPKTGGPLNDELLGHHGGDRLNGGAGRDVLWGDWDPKNNNGTQHDVLRGGTGNDFIYPSHGKTEVYAGPGKDYIWAFYGRGMIDCGPGYDMVRVRTNGAFKLRNCEVVGHFCQFGADGKGGCLKPGESRAATVRRVS
jgi:hypothetical protein